MAECSYYRFINSYSIKLRRNTASVELINLKIELLKVNIYGADFEILNIDNAEDLKKELQNVIDRDDIQDIFQAYYF
jgi:hypothetical protein